MGSEKFRIPWKPKLLIFSFNRKAMWCLHSERGRPMQPIQILHLGRVVDPILPFRKCDGIFFLGVRVRGLRPRGPVRYEPQNEILNPTPRYICGYSPPIVIRSNPEFLPCQIYSFGPRTSETPGTCADKPTTKCNVFDQEGSKTKKSTGR